MVGERSAEDEHERGPEQIEQHEQCLRGRWRSAERQMQQGQGGETEGQQGDPGKREMGVNLALQKERCGQQRTGCGRPFRIEGWNRMEMMGSFAGGGGILR